MSAKAKKTASRQGRIAGKSARVATPGHGVPPPPTWRDLWAWASALAVIPLVLKSLGAPLGEPVAEDFDFLHRALLSGDHSLLDGGGSASFWRPVSHQLYYLAFGPLMLDHPRVVAAIHALLLAASSLLVYLALRRWLSGPAAAVAASFPLFAESTRTLLSWPSHFVDLGLWFFTALALFEASRCRLWSTLAALALALGCKELAVIAALLIPWMPGLGSSGRAQRLRWAAATAALVLVWGIAYVLVRQHAHLELPHHLEHAAGTIGTPLPVRYQWAWWNSARAIFSLPLKASPLEGPMGFALAALAALTLGLLIARSRSKSTARATTRERSAARAVWIGWGLAWFAFSSATLVVIYPMWQPNRSAFGSMGLGIALAVTLEAALPLLLVGLMLVRAWSFAAGPSAPTVISAEPADTGAFMDYPHLTRLQRLMEAVHTSLKRGYPSLPHGAGVCQHNLPHLAEYAFGGNLALQAWYRDSTLRWVRYDEFHRDSTVMPVTIVEFQPDRVPIIGLVDPRVARLVQRADARIAASDWGGVLAVLAGTDTLGLDPRAGAMVAIIETRRALAYSRLDRLPECERSARRALAGWPGSAPARYWLAWALTAEERWPEAIAQLDTILATSPGDSAALALRIFVARNLWK